MKRRGAEFSRTTRRRALASKSGRMRIAVLPGDGIGPEICAAAVSVLDLLNKRFSLRLEFESHEIGLASLKKSGSTFPDEVLAACRAADGILIGPVSHLDYPPRAEGGRNPSRYLPTPPPLFPTPHPPPS